jgi:membrane-associated phospholipid phosphatase
MKGSNWFVIAASVLLSIGVVVSLVTEKGAFLMWLSGKRTTFMDYFFFYFTKVGEVHGFIVVGIILWMRSWRKMVLIPLLGGFTTLLTWGLKKYFQHERPSLYLERIDWQGPMNVLDYGMLTGHSSFPSGHSMAAWSLFTLFAFLMNNRWVSMICLVSASLVSISRVYLMAHFLQDVVTGGILGMLLGFGVFRLYLYWLTHTVPEKV